ncbi:elongation factor G [Nocardia terpenica]|uniref:GTP-binding protein n=1 Tax=Nocardia terpenica TaxID=455432 RepID=A0A291RKH7_9NOCA|nr:TetM/TetW/TetO/TetS family tetracycline resistance ribosomal protection protein [Nocardia terpenica]ATL67798.1 GTP-binding protein [Nocardia terpenica]
MPIDRTRNIGILAHVDAGKTSLTERLLFDTGAIDRLGSVDAGTTRTDTGTIERQRGITVRSAVESFRVGDTQVNVIDTPGHPDFVAEVDRVLGVLDAAVLVVSAVEGVQAHTRVLMRTVREIRLPVLIFVNKIDRGGARYDSLLSELRKTVAPHLLPMTAVTGIGSGAARALPRSLDDPAFAADTAEVLADLDDTVLARVVDGPALTPHELRAALAEHTNAGALHPVYFGSARTGAGVAALVDALIDLPRPAITTDTVARGTVFAIDRDRSGTKTAYLRLFSGTVGPRDTLTVERDEPEGRTRFPVRPTGLRVVGSAGTTRNRLHAGQIGALTGVDAVRVGDRLADPSETGTRRPYFATPTLRSVVRSRDGDAARVHAALQQLAERDTFLRVRTEPDGATSVLLYGEIQREIIAATLADEYGLEVSFDAARIDCIERVTGTGIAVEEMGYRAPGPHGFWATVGLRVAPAPTGSGNAFDYETELGALPRALHTAIEETVHAALRRGPAGWPVRDCTVTLVRSGFAAPISTAADFRSLTPIVLAQALRRAGTRVHEPTHTFDIAVPADTFAAVTALLATLEAEIDTTADGPAGWTITGTIPARTVRAAQQRLPGRTRGEGVWWSRPNGYRPVRPA